jgi:hypothetical protein
LQVHKINSYMKRQERTKKSGERQEGKNVVMMKAL